MTNDQIKEYEMSKAYLENIDTYIKKLTFPRQVFGCGSNSHRTEHLLQKIHTEMYEDIAHSFVNAKSKVQLIIDKI